MNETTRKFKFESRTVSPVRFVNKSPHWRSKKRIQNKRKKNAIAWYLRRSASKKFVGKPCDFFSEGTKSFGYKSLAFGAYLLNNSYFHHNNNSTGEHYFSFYIAPASVNRSERLRPTDNNSSIVYY